jgi:putative flippase GtrA
VIGQFRSRQFLAFLVSGGTAALINFGSRILYSQWLGFSAAVVLAYLTGMVSAFVLARLFVFSETTQPVHRSALFFTLVNVVAIAQTWAVSLFLARYLLPSLGVTSFVPEIAHAIGIVVPVFTSYLGHKRWSFK